jgi:hypothetical protein
MKSPKIEIKKIKGFIKRLLRTLGEKAFLSFLGLLFLALIFGGIIFYQYNILVKRTEVQIQEIPLKFQEKPYQDILKIWQEREERFSGAETKQYSDPFKVSAVTEESATTTVD